MTTHLLSRLALGLAITLGTAHCGGSDAVSSDSDPADGEDGGGGSSDTTPGKGGKIDAGSKLDGGSPGTGTNPGTGSKDGGTKPVIEVSSGANRGSDQLPFIEAPLGQERRHVLAEAKFEAESTG